MTAEQLVQPRHYRVSLWNSELFAPHSPARAVALAGFKVGFFYPRPITDECLFYYVTGPSEVPDWMEPCGIPEYIRAHVEEEMSHDR